MPDFGVRCAFFVQKICVFVILYYEKCLDISSEKGYHIYMRKIHMKNERKEKEMQTTNRENYTPVKKSVVALGNFDGVHLGHATLIETAVALAKEHGLSCCVYTFSAHPANFKNGINSIITDNREKESIISSLGADVLCLDDFEAVKGFSCREFCEEILVNSLGCEIAVCGDNYGFGANRSGNFETLKSEMEALSKKAVVIECLKLSDVTVNSTLIRELICGGEVDKAAELLGRRYSFSSMVLHGKQLGRLLGSPTVNQIIPDKKLIPKNGVYITVCYADGKKYAGVTNVGKNPTVNDENAPTLCETHLVGYEGDLYGKDVRIEFCKRLRDEKKFPSLDALKEEISRNVVQALEYFKEEERV